MKNKTWLIVTVCMLLASAVILTGCMVAIAQQEEPSKPYEMGEAVSLVPEDAPTAQTELEAKFAVYNHVAEVGNEKILFLFSHEQAEEQWQKRQNGEDFRLTYDEILFLINDSLQLYRTYDEIHLTDALKNGIFSTEMSCNDCVIYHNKEDVSGMTYRGEQEAYEQMLYDVTRIAPYRIAMLDSRMRQIDMVSVPCSGMYGSINTSMMKLSFGMSILELGLISRARCFGAAARRDYVTAWSTALSGTAGLPEASRWLRESILHVHGLCATERSPLRGQLNSWL